MRTRLLMLSTALLAGGALASPALAAPTDKAAGPKDQPAMMLETTEVQACGSTILIEDLGGNARERFTEGETSFSSFVRGNGSIRFTDVVTGETATVKIPGRARAEGSFDPVTGEGSVTVDLAGVNLLLPEPFVLPVEAAAQDAFGLPQIAIVYGRFVATTSGNINKPLPDKAVIQRAGNRVVDVCDLLEPTGGTVKDDDKPKLGKPKKR